MSSEPPASATSHILGRDGAPVPKQPQSSVRPRSRAASSAEKKTTEISATASAPTRLVGGQSSRRPHATSNGGRLSGSSESGRHGREGEQRNAAEVAQNLPCKTARARQERRIGCGV